MTDNPFLIFQDISGFACHRGSITSFRKCMGHTGVGLKIERGSERTELAYSDSDLRDSDYDILVGLTLKSHD
jgi:hypothetical protein